MQTSQDYDISGSNNPRTILFIHGAGVTRQWWHPQVADLADEFRLIAPDLPGHGTRANTPFRLQNAVAVLQDLIESETGNPILLVGISLGGYLAINLAYLLPQRVAGLLLCGSSVNLAGLTGLSFKFTGSMLKRKGAAWLEDVTLTSYRKRISPELLEPVIRSGFFPKAAVEAFFESSGQNYYKMLQDYPGPILLANGEKDEANRKAEKAFLRAVPRTQSAPILEASHLTNLEQTEKFNDTIRSFANSLNW
jgi:pimeloyl-ACP methyl ester carboxylesterase